MSGLSWRHILADQSFSTITPYFNISTPCFPTPLPHRSGPSDTRQGVLFTDLQPRDDVVLLLLLQRQRYATACCAYRLTFIRCLSINPPPPPSLPPPPLGIPKPPPPGGGHAPRGAPSTRAARLLGRTHRPRLTGVRCPRATLCQRPLCVSRAAHHRAKRRAGVWC